MFKNSEELKLDLLGKVSPWFRSIVVPPFPTPEWLIGCESAVKTALGSQVMLYIQEGTLPREVVEGDPEAWLTRVVSPIRVLLERPNAVAPPQLGISNLGVLAHEVLKPLMLAKAPASAFVRSVMSQARVQAAVGDEFNVSQEERALRDILDPTRVIPTDTRSKMAEQLQESLRIAQEKKKELEDRQEAVANAKFGRLLDID